jgi:DNA-binding MarR family transcriptional regulator
MSIDQARPVTCSARLSPVSGSDVSVVLADALVLSTRLQHITQCLATQALRDAGLTVPQWLVLRHLHGNTGGSTLTALATAMDHDRGGLSRILYQLRQRQLVTTLAQQGDRRSVWLALAPAGRSLCNALERSMRPQLERVLEQVTSQDALRQLTCVMEKAAAALRTLSGETASVSDRSLL